MPYGTAKFQILSIPRPWFLTSNVSGSGTNVLNDQSKLIIRIYYDDQLTSFVDVDRSNGAFKTTQKAFHQIARFDVHTLPNDHHVMLNKVSYWTKWGEYVNTQRLSNSS